MTSVEPVHVHVAILSVGSTTARAGVAMENVVADALTTAGHQISAFESVRDSEVAIRAQLTGWIEDPDVDMVIVVGEGEATSKALKPLVEESIQGFADLLRMMAFQEVGASAMLSAAEAAKCGGSTFVFVVPGNEKAVQQAMDKLILPQLDPKTQPRNLVSQMPRLREEADVTRVDNASGPADSIPTAIPKEKTQGGVGITRLPAKPAPQLMTRVKSATGKNVIVRNAPPDAGPVEDPTKPIELQKLEEQLEKSKPTTETRAMDVSALPPGAEKALFEKPVNRNVLGDDKHVFSAKTNPAYVPVTKDPAAVVDDGPTIREPKRPVSDNKPTVVGPAPTRPAPSETVVGTAPTRPPPSDTIVDSPPPETSPDAAYRAEGVTTVRPAAVQIPPKPPARPTPAIGSPTVPKRPTPAIGSPTIPKRPTPAIGSPTVPMRTQTPSAPVARITPVPKVASNVTPFVAKRLGAIPGGTPELDPAVSPDPAVSIEELDSSLLRESSTEIPPILDQPAPHVVPLADLAKQVDATRDSAPTVDLAKEAARPAQETEKKPATIMAAAPPATLESLIPPMPANVERVREPTPAPPTPVVKRPPTQPPPQPRAEPAPFEAEPGPPKKRRPTAPPPDFAMPVSAQVAELPQGSFDYTIKKPRRWPLILLALIAAGTIAFFVFKIVQSGKSPDGLATARDAAAAVADAAPAEAEVVAQAPVDATEIEIDIDAAVAVDAAKAANPVGPVGPTNRTPTNPPTRTPVDAGVVTPPPIDAAPLPDVPVAASPDCDEVSCVLEKYQRPCCQRFKPPDNNFTPGGDGATSLQKPQIKAGVDRVRGGVIACGDKNPAKGTVKVTVTVDGEGAVTAVSVVETPDSALGNCVAGVMRKAQFAKTTNGGSFTYPFVF